ncbi:MAG: glutamine--tRNA ligase/YqeY domain fusion protein [Gammaproteobacteria bacterium]|nr:glutamine--tRNA ligase/YqeY domain fusion protein [Gammaproteobacteria bacterium]
MNNSTTTHFIRKIIEDDIAQGRCPAGIHTRFPPEPNGYLHIGHAKAICLNFGMATEYQGKCNLRFDDTNPEKEDLKYVEAIQEDVRWLGFDWEDRLFFASDYFTRLFEFAVALIEQGKAYVDALSAEQMREYRGTLTEPGVDSPYRERPVAENLDLFRRMKAGEFADGELSLRAKIDMRAPNLNLRDPVIYRIRRTPHYRAGAAWCIYPMYDFTHCLSDALEHVTHSLCSLEFEDHRPLYDWFIDNLDTPARPRQYEFARLNLEYTVLSKRRLVELVEGGYVRGWDDPRMPTLSGLRRRGFTPHSLRTFCARIGLTKNDTWIDASMLEHAIRDELGVTAPRRMAVLRPLKVVIDNYPDDQEELLDAANHPQDPSMGTRQIPFGKVLYIEQDDFMEDAPRKFFRLAPGREVRLRYAYFITCNEVIKDAASGAVLELRCSYDPATRGGNAPDGRKVKGTLHWVSARHAQPAQVRLYDRLFAVANPDQGKQDWKSCLNPASLKILDDCLIEPDLTQAAPEQRFQFERLGYFCADRQDWQPDQPVFNRIVTLRDSWAKMGKR